jgi:hypothetical protein
MKLLKILFFCTAFVLQLSTPKMLTTPHKHHNGELSLMGAIFGLGWHDLQDER